MYKAFAPDEDYDHKEIKIAFKLATRLVGLGFGKQVVDWTHGIIDSAFLYFEPGVEKHPKWREPGTHKGVFICYNSRTKMITVYGIWPYGMNEEEMKPHNLTTESISVHAARSAESIMRDIKRRLMPIYDHAFQVAEKMVIDEKEDAMYRNGTKNDLLSALGDHGSEVANDKDAVRFFNGDFGVDFRVGSSSVMIDRCYVPRQVALDFAEAIKRFGNN